MGAWGTDLFSDDVACDVRDHYRELLEDGVDDAAAIERTVDKFRAHLDEVEGVALIAFAVTQSRLGRLDPHFRDRAVAAIDRGADLAMWEQDNPRLLPKRRAVLAKARARLTGPQPARKRLRPPKRPGSGLAAGDLLELTLPDRVALVRVVRVRLHRKGETPVLEEVDSDLRRTVTDPIATDPISGDTRFFAFVMQGVDWHGAGFQKVRTISPRAGDEEAPLPHAGISWAELASTYRRRRS